MFVTRLSYSRFDRTCHVHWHWSSGDDVIKLFECRINVENPDAEGCMDVNIVLYERSRSVLKPQTVRKRVW
jgi:hypothetical protein